MKISRLQPCYEGNGFLVVVKTESSPQEYDYQLIDNKCVRKEKSEPTEEPIFIVVLDEEGQFVGLYKEYEPAEKEPCSVECNLETASCWQKVY